MNADDAKSRAGRVWFGYGRWDAPYWFVGMEPGGKDENASYESWLRLGGSELLDCKAHHLDCEFTRWHIGPRPPTQSTWRRLIQALLAFKGEPTDLDAVRVYQRDRWGMSNDETASIELVALHAPSLSHASDRTAHREERVSTIQKRLFDNKPTFAIFYGGYRDEYERIVGDRFDADGFAMCGPTVCALTPHPTAWLNRGGWTEDRWINIGKELRRKADGSSL